MHVIWPRWHLAAVVQGDCNNVSGFRGKRLKLIWIRNEWLP